MIALVPSYLFVEAELVSKAISRGLLRQKEYLTKTIEELRQHPVFCSPGRKETSTGRIGPQRVVDLFESVLAPTFDVNHPFQSDTLFWSLKNGVPYTAGLYTVYFASGHTQDLLAHLTRRLDLCRRVSGDDEDEARKEEKRSQAWLDEQRQELEKLDRDLATARKAYEEDRPKLAAVAWTLGILQVVGWSLLYFVVLPQDVRAWRQRRAAKKSGPA